MTPDRDRADRGPSLRRRLRLAVVLTFALVALASLGVPTDLYM